MKISFLRVGVLIAVITAVSMSFIGTEIWGFYGHRLINRTAVFTLPVELIPLFKSNIDYITEQSVAPDKRRHASPLEAIRHYIDIDHWGEEDISTVPRDIAKAMFKYGGLFVLNSKQDTVEKWDTERKYNSLSDSLAPYVIHEISRQSNEVMESGSVEIPIRWLESEYPSGAKLYFEDHFSSFGILPYNLLMYQKRLENAFQKKEWTLVLRLSAEIGHYISDAHVPLHTTENYNGQMTGQKGIHAFWESRLPELFAEGEYDLFTGRAKYIENMDDFIWKIVNDSHALVDEVLGKEKELSLSFDRDKQFCFEFRGAQQVRQACEGYARAYQQAMNDMVENRMRASIAAVGSIWYTSWVNAGRPIIDQNDILNLNELQIDSTQMIGEHQEVK
ncbi:MAG: hypothetical protein ACJA01_002223 [Saprospiraceae bacterium]|jgi:hypothetical protein